MEIEDTNIGRVLKNNKIVSRSLSCHVTSHQPSIVSFETLLPRVIKSSVWGTTLIQLGLGYWVERTFTSKMCLGPVSICGHTP